MTTLNLISINDGLVQSDGSFGGDTWANVRAGLSLTRGNSVSTTRLTCTTTSYPDKFRYLARGFETWDLATLPVGASVVSAVIKLKPYSVNAEFAAHQALGVYSATPTDVEDIATADWSQVGSSLLSNAVDYADLVLDAYTEFTLGSAGRALIAVAAGGKICFSLRNCNDAADTEPDWENAKISFSAFYGFTVGGSEPILEIEYLAGPTVTTQAVTNIHGTYAIGNGTITNIGDSTCTKRGFCWNTTGSPTVADSKVESTGSFGTGAFALTMTNLLPLTTYYVKAYAYNSAGYSYGGEVNFTTIGSLYPSETLARVTGLVHRWSPGNYTLEIFLGDTLTDWVTDRPGGITGLTPKPVPTLPAAPEKEFIIPKLPIEEPKWFEFWHWWD